MHNEPQLMRPRKSPADFIVQGLVAALAGVILLQTFPEIVTWMVFALLWLHQTLIG